MSMNAMRLFAILCSTVIIVFILSIVVGGSGGSSDPQTTSTLNTQRNYFETIKHGIETTPSPEGTTVGWQKFDYSLPQVATEAPRTLYILYPPSLTIHRINSETISVVSSQPQPRSGDFGVTITLLDPKSLSLHDFVDKLTFPGPSTGIEKRDTFSPISVARLNGFRVSAVGVGGQNLGVFLPYNGKVVAITASYVDLSNNQGAHLFDQMVSSIRLD